MKRQRKNTQIGIWVNSKCAYVIELTPASEPLVTKISSGVQARVREPGEEKPFMQFQTTYANEEAHKQARAAELKRKFFKRIIHKIEHGDHFVILGPGKTRKEFCNLINKNLQTRNKVVDTAPTGELRKEEVIVRVKNFFEGNNGTKKKNSRQN